VFDGGLALCEGGHVLVEPSCCVDLGNLSDWRQPAAYRGEAWQMLWVGHPWLSVRSDGDGLVLSGPHESSDPVARWLVGPAELARAVALAQAELEGLAARLRPALPTVDGGAAAVARRLAGLPG
jgi:hypothetical protein